MSKQILILVTAILATTAFPTIDDRLLPAQPKRNVAYQPYNYVPSALKGAATAALLTTVTGGGYSLFAGFKFGNLIVNQLRGKNAATQGKRERLKELINWGSQTLVSVPLALALWGVFGQNYVTRARGIVLKHMNPFGLPDIEKSWESHFPEDLATHCTISVEGKKDDYDLYAVDLYVQNECNKLFGASSPEQFRQELFERFKLISDNPKASQVMRKRACTMINNKHQLSMYATNVYGFIVKNSDKQARKDIEDIIRASITCSQMSTRDAESSCQVAQELSKVMLQVVNSSENKEEKKEQVQAPVSIAIKGRNGQVHSVDNTNVDSKGLAQAHINKINEPVNFSSPKELYECMLENAREQANNPNTLLFLRQQATIFINLPYVMVSSTVDQLYNQLKTDPNETLDMMQKCSMPDMPSCDEIKAALLVIQELLKQNRRKKTPDNSTPKANFGPKFPVKQDWQSQEERNVSTSFQYNPETKWNNVSAPYRPAELQNNAINVVDDPIPIKVIVDSGLVTIECCDEE